MAYGSLTAFLYCRLLGGCDLFSGEPAKAGTLLFTVEAHLSLIAQLAGLPSMVHLTA